MGLSSIKHGAPASFISGFHSETEQSAQAGGSREGEIAMKRPSPLSTKLYKKGGMRKIAVPQYNGGGELGHLVLVWVACLNTKTV